jgi:hypothetical protein
MQKSLAKAARYTDNKGFHEKYPLLSHLALFEFEF